LLSASENQAELLLDDLVGRGLLVAIYEQ